MNVAHLWMSKVNIEKDKLMKVFYTEFDFIASLIQ